MNKITLEYYDIPTHCAATPAVALSLLSDYTIDGYDPSAQWSYKGIITL